MAGKKEAGKTNKKKLKKSKKSNNRTKRNRFSPVKAIQRKRLQTTRVKPAHKLNGTAKHRQGAATLKT